MNNSLDPIRYIRPPRMSVRSGVSLGRILLVRLPEEPTPGMITMAQNLAIKTDTLEDRWKARQEIPEVTKVRPFDQRLDRVLSIIESSLSYYAVFDPEDADRQRAGELHDWLFPTGLDFTQFPYMEQHAECQRRIDLIEEKGIRPDLERLVGAKFIQAMYEAHEAYGEALGITRDSPVTPPSVSLRAPLRDLSQAVSDYALQVLAFAALDPANVAPARHALEPIDRLRQDIARRAASRERTALDPDDVELDDVGLDDAPQAEPATPEREALAVVS